MENCKHNFVHKETLRVKEIEGRSNSNCETWKQQDIYFCSICLEEKTINKYWCGVPHERDRPEWTKMGEFRKVTIW